MTNFISIIICTYNRDKYIYQTLEKIAQNNFPTNGYEIVLINNKSTDKTAAECDRFHQNYPSVDYHYFVESNQGLSYARNRGIIESTGDFLVFLDDDAFVDKDYLQNLLHYLEQYPDTKAFGGKIDPFYESGIPPKWMSKWSYSWVSALNKGQKVCKFTNTEYPIGANMGVKKSIVDKCGMFNVDLGRTGNNLMGGEEKDFFNRIKATGADILYFPEIKVMHCIPEKRLTKDFIIRLANGIGMSERVRTKNISTFSFIKRCFSELIKWCGTTVLWVSFLLKGTIQKGNILFLFRWNVTKGLLGK